MIVVKIEMWPKGREEKKYSLGEVRITNDATGNIETGNYNVEIDHVGMFKEKRNPYKKGRVEGFARTLSPYRLLYRALEAVKET